MSTRTKDCYRAALALLVALALGKAASADTVYLKNGDRVSGKVDSISGAKLVVATDYAGSVVIDIAKVSLVETAGEFDVIEKSGTRFTGKLSAEGDVQGVVDQSGFRGLPLEEIGVLRQNRVGVLLPDDWTSRLDLAGIVSRGNSQTDSYAVRAESKLDRVTTQHLAKGSYDRALDGGEITKDQGEADYAFRWFFRPAWYATTGANYFTDKVKDIDQRITASAGLGHQFWDTSLGALTADLSVAQVFEDLEGDDSSSPALKWGLGYNRFLFGKSMELFHNHSILKILDDERGYVINGAFGLRFVITERLDTNVRVDVLHETEPLEDRGKTDTTYSMGLGFKL